MSVFYVLLLGFAVSLDSFAAGIAYGLKAIRMPFSSLTIIGLITAACTGFSMWCAKMLGQFIDVHIAVIFGSLLLITLGGFNLFQEYLTKDIPASDIENEFDTRKVTLKIGKLIICIMANPEIADIDKSKSISPMEAIFLGLALGIDNMVATFAASLMGFLPFYTPLIMGVVQMAFLACGSWSSSHLVSESLKKRFPFLPGAILILIGLARLV
ncbi:putative sporulation protein YtaF [Sporomusa rhizae]|uniref:sporulation membrane protein YtaF n=1 Tax=Sporomusa rhizae TaxID=357999 RepID=UPI00352A034A